MTSLRQRMIEDMQVRNLSVNTQDSYIQQVSRFARHFQKSPDLLGAEQIRAYQVFRLGDVSAVDCEACSGDEARFVRGQVGDEAGDLRYITHSLQRNQRLDQLGNR